MRERKRKRGQLERGRETRCIDFDIENTSLFATSIGKLHRSFLTIHAAVKLILRPQDLHSQSACFPFSFRVVLHSSFSFQLVSFPRFPPFPPFSRPIFFFRCVPFAVNCSKRLFAAFFVSHVVSEQLFRSVLR